MTTQQILSSVLSQTLKTSSPPHLLHLPLAKELSVNTTTETGRSSCPTSHSYSRDIYTEPVILVSLHSS